MITPDDILTGTRLISPGLLKDRCQEIVDMTLQTNRQIRKSYAISHVLYGELWVIDIALMIIRIIIKTIINTCLNLKLYNFLNEIGT